MPVRNRSVNKKRASREDTFRSRLSRSLKIEQFEERTLLSIGTWEPLGPAPINYADSQVENVLPTDADIRYLNQVVGSITAVAAHPTNPDILYVGTTNGGVWRTDNATAASPTWMQLTTTPSPSPSARSYSIRPIPPTRHWVAGVGRFSDYYRQGGELTGLIRTINGGETWTQIDGDGVLDGKNCISIAVRGDTILVAADNAANGSYASVGLFRSEDGGETFNQISDGDGSATGLPGGITYDLAADPNDHDVFYTVVVGADTPGGFDGENGIYKSEDGGESWLKISSADDVDEYLNSTGGGSHAPRSIERRQGRPTLRRRSQSVGGFAPVRRIGRDFPHRRRRRELDRDGPAHDNG